MTNRPLSILVCLVALALVGVGCGSSDKSSEKPSITKAEFVKKGNAICAQGNKEIETKGREIFGTDQSKKPTEAEQTKFATTVLIPSVESQVADIRALGAPKGDEAQVKAILDAADEGIAESKKDPLALVQTEGAGPFAKANKLAAAYGLKTCGS